MEDNKRWRMAAIPFFLARGMVRTGSGAVCRVQGESRGAAGPALDLPRGGSRGGVCVCVCVCAGVGAQQGGIPDPSTLPSKLMQL